MTSLLKSFIRIFQFACAHRKEYIKWIEEAKKTETRQNRIIKAIEKLSDGQKDML
jgi:uncharacterized protein YdeI (YjbR/CyaY-like superfamily)